MAMMPTPLDRVEWLRDLHRLVNTVHLVVLEADAAELGRIAVIRSEAPTWQEVVRQLG